MKASNWLVTLPIVLLSQAPAPSLGPPADAAPAAGPAAPLPPQTTDLTIRFQHVEPVLHDSRVVAHWPLDEGSGYEALDQSGRGHTAYLTGTTWNTDDSGLTATFRRRGKRGGAIYLNGTQWLQAQDAPGLNLTGPLTVAAWLNPDAGPAALGGVAVLEKSAAGKGYRLSCEPNGSLRLTVYDATGRAHTVQSRPGQLVRGQWAHVLATADPASGQLLLYLNGQPSGRAKEQPFTLGLAPADLRLGHSAAGTGGFRGWLDEVTLLSQAVSDAQARQLYAVGLPKLYTQTRETVDPARTEWTEFKGNQPVPHPLEDDTRLLLRFDGSLASLQGQAPTSPAGAAAGFVPGQFGGAFDAVRNTKGLVYASPLTEAAGTAEAWFTPVANPKDPSRTRKYALLQASGINAELTLGSENKRWTATLSQAGQPPVVAQSPEQPFLYGQLVHLAVAWGNGYLTLYLNGVEADRRPLAQAPVLNKHVVLGGQGTAAAHGYLDDVRLSGRVRAARGICPRGHQDTESAALDLMQGFDHAAGEPLWHWQPASKTARWAYAAKSWEDDGTRLGDSGDLRRGLKQGTSAGFHALFHPDAYGHASSIEAGVSFEAVADGWAGVFVQAATPAADQPFTGYTFALNPGQNQLRLARIVNGAAVASKVLPYDFQLKPRQTYTLTLSSVGGVLRGYLDGHNLISLAGAAPDARGFGGLFTDNTPAYFDDVHFSALTPAVAQSRSIQQRFFTDESPLGLQPVAKNGSLNAFRWKKRYGLLPWQRTYQSPEPPGNLFGPTDSVARPNATQFWRSEDAANSDVLAVDGRVFYFMRGNPDYQGPHGAAALGVLTADDGQFDGRHFQDLSAGLTNLDQAPALLRGHQDRNSTCNDGGPRATRLQVNDEGAVYQNGKILVFAREFRNGVRPYPWFRRLIYGVFDVATQRWDQNVPHLVSWSMMSPDSCYSRHRGLDATPEVVSLRDPATDEYVIFLYHHSARPGPLGGSTPTTEISGLRYDGRTVSLHPAYPSRNSIVKHNQDNIYGERILFDNGIYYLNVNADSEKLVGDWPDRFELFAGLHPYDGPWTGSADNTNPARPYFSRGSRFDPDNGAIWQGTMVKRRGRYYLYYENFHVVNDLETPYEFYDHKHSGSRVGFATGN